MDRQIIIDELLNDKSIIKYCHVIGGENKNDLFQNTWLKILELSEDKLKDIHSKGYLTFFIYRMICNTSKDFIKSENIRSKYIGNSQQKTEPNLENQIINKIELDKINLILSKLHWYDRKLFEIYLEEGSCRKVQAKVGINYNSVQETVKKVRTKLANGIDRKFKN